MAITAESMGRPSVRLMALFFCLNIIILIAFTKESLGDNTEARCGLVGAPGSLLADAGPANSSWEIFNITIDPVQVVPQPPETYTYDVNTTSNMSFVLVDPIRNASVFCSGVTQMIDDYPNHYQDSCTYGDGKPAQNPWYSFYFLADKSLYLNINETWICGDDPTNR